MIKPPFTLLILKSPHKPVAIRVSVPLFILLLAIIPVLSGAAGYGFSRLFSGSRGSMHLPLFAARQQSGQETGEPSGDGTVSPDPRPEISGLFVSSAREGGTDVTFSLSNTFPEEKYYIWVVANPDAAGSDGVFIYPRNPVFRGLPIDYRNGIPHDRTQGSKIALTIGEEEPRLTLEMLRVLVYSAEGKLLIDKQFTVGKDTRSSSP